MCDDGGGDGGAADGSGAFATASHFESAGAWGLGIYVGVRRSRLGALGKGSVGCIGLLHGGVWTSGDVYALHGMGWVHHRLKYTYGCREGFGYPGIEKGLGTLASMDLK